jgi:hypothetical protein
MKNSFVIFSCVLALLACDNRQGSGSGSWSGFGQGTKVEGPIVEEILTLETFDALNLQGPFPVRITQGPEQKVTARGHANIIAKLATEVKNREWQVDLQSGNYGNYELTVDITVPLMRAIELDGAGSITMEGFNRWENFAVEIDGVGSLMILGSRGQMGRVVIDMKGTGSFEVPDDQALLADFLDVDLDGVGSLNAYGIETKSAQVNLDGVGSVNIYATEDLKIDLDGVGSVNYRGNPKLTRDINGFGESE